VTNLTKKNQMKLEATQLLTSRSAARTFAAHRLRDFRTLRFAGGGCSLDSYRRLVRIPGWVGRFKDELAAFRGLAYMAPRATPARLRLEAKQHRDYARTRFGPIVLDDGYALCGEEDARGERQAASGRLALVLEQAARMLDRA
jgi:hypothetical protein